MRGSRSVVMLYRESYEDRDTVLEQRPARGQMVYEGTEVTIWIARRGYLEHLPAIYRRSDAVGRNLVRDLCFLFEHMFDSIEQQPRPTAGGSTIRTSRRRSSSTGSRGGRRSRVDLDWPEAQKRALIKRAVDLYRIRGTKRGLDAVPQAVHRPRARHRREHLAVQGIPGRGRGCRGRRAHRRSTRWSCRRSISRTASS